MGPAATSIADWFARHLGRGPETEQAHQAAIRGGH